ncbi:MAG: MarR family EPS-associated transcriptional regulator [Pseudorhodobacter sp.]|nr:MarR family EPS-associated transcriptional regulator [Pseudorhodobacter sp.]
MAGQRSKLQEDVRVRVVRLLQENPEIIQRDLAATVGIGVGSTDYLLSVPVEKDLVKLGNFSSAGGKRHYAYILTPKGIAEKSCPHRALSAPQDGRIRHAEGRDRSASGRNGTRGRYGAADPE